MNEENDKQKDALKNRFSKYILTSLEFENHGVWSSDPCENVEELTEIPKNVTDTLFPRKTPLNSDSMNNRMNTFKYCLPSPIHYQKMMLEVGNGTDIPQWYLDIFSDSLARLKFNLYEN